MNLDHLKARLEHFKKDKKTPTQQRVKHYKLTSFFVCVEIVACVLTGLFVGAVFDYWFSTKWTFKIICMLLSFLANMIVLYRIMIRD